VTQLSADGQSSDTTHVRPVDNEQCPPLRGTAYGLRQSLDSIGAFAGPLCAVALMIWLA
jgi:hypothetical protein